MGLQKSPEMTPQKRRVLGHPKALQMGVSENSVPQNPMVNDHYPY